MENIRKRFIKTTSKKWWGGEINRDEYRDSIVFIEDENQVWTNGICYNSGLFQGTQEEYNVAYKAGRIPNGTIVIIVDDTPETGGDTTAVLGVAVLGKMVLGQE